jgi:Iodothyronine deiodinase
MEAHPIDAWQDEDNDQDHVHFASPKTLDQRAEVAHVCLNRLAVKLPAVLDNLQNTTEIAYTAWPDRLYVIGRDGRITFKTKPGPFGFKPAGVEETLKKLLPPAQAKAVAGN